MSKSDKNSRRQIEILKAQLAERKPSQSKKSVKVISRVDLKELPIDPKFYKDSLLKTVNLSFIMIAVLLALYAFQDKWFGLINLNF